MNDSLSIDTSIIEAGAALAELAREIAAESVRASGDVMDGACAIELAEQWDRACRFYEHQVGESVPYTLGRMAGQEKGTALREELIELGVTLVRGFGAALALAGDPPDDLTDTEYDSLEQVQLIIAAANGAAARLRDLVVETA